MNSSFLPSYKFKGLGDVVHAMAQPIAKGIDAAAKAIGRPTKISNCGGCKRRRDALNKSVPFHN